jgi:hypothetical protein
VRRRSQKPLPPVAMNRMARSANSAERGRQRRAKGGFFGSAELTYHIRNRGGCLTAGVARCGRGFNSSRMDRGLPDALPRKASQCPDASCRREFPTHGLGRGRLSIHL